MIPITKEALDAAGGQLVYYLREIAPAIENRVTGMHYDESWIYAVSVTWDDVNNQAAVQYAAITEGVVGEYTDYVPGSFVFEHSNTYESNVSVTLDLTGKKTINGQNDLGGRQFSFSLYEATAAFVAGKQLSSVQNSGNSIAFRNIRFTAPGVYYLVAKEDASSLGGITIDRTEYHITVEVEKYSDGGTTRLRVVDGYPTVIPYGASEDVGKDGLNFNNTYTVTGSGEVTIGGTKILSGRTLVAEEFTIGLYSDAACENLIESVTNKADGSFSFSAITYTAADLGENYAGKTYFYYVKEIPGNSGGVSYDPNTYTVTVKLSHQDGVLTVSPSANAAALQIRNTYKAKSVTVTIPGRKELAGDWTAVSNKDFTFELYRADESFTVSGSAIQTATVTGADDFNLYLGYADGEEGTYYYVLKENISSQAGGVGYDAGEYHITVNISDPGDGQLVASKTIYRPGSGESATAVFSNSYTVEPTSITLQGTKHYVSSASGDPLPMRYGMFHFLVLENGTHVATGYNLASGPIEFTPIEYTAAGVHHYEVVEQDDGTGGIHYDDKVFSVTVTVTDNGDGTLTAVADYHGEDLVFTNSYQTEAAQLNILGNKALSGNWSAVANQDFTFELHKTDATNAIGENTLVQTITASAGDFQFGTLSITEEGTFYYAIIERSGESGKGITYDDTVYTFRVVTQDNGAGKLVPTVESENSAVTITADSADACKVSISGIAFTNAYQAAPASYAPTATKLYEGDGMKTFDFVLEAAGHPSQLKQNDADGLVTFDKLYFDATGVYQVTIREQESTLFGLIRWDVNVYTITLEVEDDGLGQLFIDESKITVTSDKGRTDLTFRNVHHSVITKKDVLLPGRENISIDGKAVEVGDELLYTISYTNYDSIPVSIEISDTIPLYTTYVDGSADCGGVLDAGTLRWTISDIAPDATVTVSFRVKVSQTNVTVSNTATVAEGNNTYHTNEVTNPVKQDEVTKDVFRVASPTVSINGQRVNIDDVLLYTITYHNSDDLAATVTITDTIPQYTSYVDGSADCGGVLDAGKITWVLQLEAGESKTVSFRVRVCDGNITVVNQATALEGNNRLQTNIVTNRTVLPPETPQTGDEFSYVLWGTLLTLSMMSMAVLLLNKKRFLTEE